MSEAIQKVAGARLRNVLGTMTSRRIFGISTGFIVTALVQSSSATTVMIVSFVNAGLLTLMESIGVIMGANLGTTVTAWIVAGWFEIGKISLNNLSLPIIALALPMYFIKKEKVKLWAEVFIGLAILFIGLSLMRDSLPDLSSNTDALSFVKNFSYNDKTYFGKISIALLFVLVGVVITILLQSSSAAMVLTLILTSEGWISFPLAAALILGENIGTTITANIAAWVANVHGKRAARSHFIFNLTGVLIALIVFPIFLNFVAYLSKIMFSGDPNESYVAIPLALCLFHSLFNLFNIILGYSFISRIARLATWLVPSKGVDDEVYSLDFMGSSLLETSELSLVEARKALVKFGDLMRRAYKYIPMLVTEMDEDKLTRYTKKLQKYEDISDRMEMEISNYLSSISRGELSTEGSKRVRVMLHVANYLERIGDIYLEISRNLSNRKEQKAYFTQEMRSNVIQLSELVTQSLDQMLKDLESSERTVDFERSKKIKKEVSQTFKKFKEDYIIKVEKGKYRIQSGMYYSDLLSEMERIANHAASISESLKDQS